MTSVYYSSGELLEDSQSTPLENSTCNAGCCEDLDAPNQLIGQAVLDSTKQQIGNKSEHPTLNPQWYKEIPWIHLCYDRKKIFFHCLSAYKGLLQRTRRFETAFFIEGFKTGKRQ